MKRTLIKEPLAMLPDELSAFLSGATVYDSSCSPEARVYFIERGDGFYLKTAERGTLKREAEMTAYFHAKGIGAELLSYTSGEGDYMLTRAVRGEDCVHPRHLGEPMRLAAFIGERLRELHEMDCRDCPVRDRVGEYLALAHKNYECGSSDKCRH